MQALEHSAAPVCLGAVSGLRATFPQEQPPRGCLGVLGVAESGWSHKYRLWKVGNA